MLQWHLEIQNKRVPSLDHPVMRMNMSIHFIVHCSKRRHPTLCCHLQDAEARSRDDAELFTSPWFVCIICQKRAAQSSVIVCPQSVLVSSNCFNDPIDANSIREVVGLHHQITTGSSWFLGSSDNQLMVQHMKQRETIIFISYWTTE